MKNLHIASSLTPFIVLMFAILGCNMSTANISEVKTSKDKAGTQTSSTFKTGETIFAKTTVSNNPGKVKVKTYLTGEDVKGLTNGEPIKGSEVTVELDGDGVSEYELPVPQTAPSGKYKLITEMSNEAGEKKDSKTAEITIEQSETAPPTEDPQPDADQSTDN
jgi:hypothetical protein